MLRLLTYSEPSTLESLAIDLSLLVMGHNNTYVYLVQEPLVPRLLSSFLRSVVVTKLEQANVRPDEPEGPSCQCFMRLLPLLDEW